MALGDAKLLTRRIYCNRLRTATSAGCRPAWARSEVIPLNKHLSRDCNVGLIAGAGH
jgi:hypothetical protein